MPLGLITLVMSGVVFPDVIYQESLVNLVWLPYITIYGLILPLLLFLVHLIKKRMLKADIKK
jgi:spore germination protein KB